MLMSHGRGMNTMQGPLPYKSLLVLFDPDWFLWNKERAGHDECVASLFTAGQTFA